MIIPSDYRNCQKKRKYVLEEDAKHIARKMNAQNLMKNKSDRAHIYFCRLYKKC
ncbi:MAG: hypothetical protein AABY22_11960 [Nanoarchaeota archaeon]